MLTEVKAYSSWQSAPTLPLDSTGRAETDLIRVHNIDGLTPVKASVNTSPYGSVDGAAYVGSSILSRNIVLTLGPNPDWITWTHESLRKLIYLYFMPKQLTKLVFYSDNMDPVEISGIVEDVDPNPFSQNPEFRVSIICPDPYFTALNATVVTGTSIHVGELVTTITYNGNIATGIRVRVAETANGTPAQNLNVKIDNNDFFVDVATYLSSTKDFEMSSLSRQKFVQSIDLNTGVITNLLSKVEEGSAWPILQAGENDFSIVVDHAQHDWELTYFERFGGL